MRKLATIATIDEVLPIEGADRIERVRVRGWWCVSRKGEFKVGDKAVYFETDSFLPVIPEFEFLSKGSSPKKMIVGGEEKQGYRLKTVFLRKQISQGLALPVSTFPKVADKPVGEDVSADIGVLLYEPPMDVSLAGEAVGALPGIIPKTDEERCVSEETVIVTDKGKKAISEVLSDTSIKKVLCFDHEVGKSCYRSLLGRSSKRNAGGWVRITTDSGKSTVVTGDHLVWSEDDQCYRRADNLSVGEAVRVITS
jgi:RNA ligase (TIGR02306 family)